MIKIIPPTSDKLTVGTGVRIETIDGVDIGEFTTSVNVRFNPDDFVTAELTVRAAMDEVWALPFMSEQSFLDAAKRYGYDVTKRAD